MLSLFLLIDVNTRHSDAVPQSANIGTPCSNTTTERKHKRKKKKPSSADAVSSLKVFTINMFTPSMAIIAAYTKIPCLLCSNTFMCMTTNKKAQFLYLLLTLTLLPSHLSFTFSLSTRSFWYIEAIVDCGRRHQIVLIIIHQDLKECL